MRRTSCCLFVALAAILPGPELSGTPEAVEQAAVETRNIEAVRAYFSDVWSRGELEAVERFYDPACKQYGKFSIEGFKRNVTRQRASFPDFRVIIIDAFAFGDRVVSRVIFKGTHSGAAFLGIEPAGAAVEVTGMDVFVLKDGKCIEHWHEADHLELLLQLGASLKPPIRETADSGGR